MGERFLTFPPELLMFGVIDPCRILVKEKVFVFDSSLSTTEQPMKSCLCCLMADFFLAIFRGTEDFAGDCEELKTLERLSALPLKSLVSPKKHCSTALVFLIRTYFFVRSQFYCTDGTAVPGEYSLTPQLIAHVKLALAKVDVMDPTSTGRKK